jgi:hypothetical protein
VVDDDGQPRKRFRDASQTLSKTYICRYDCSQACPRCSHIHKQAFLHFLLPVGPRTPSKSRGCVSGPLQSRTCMIRTHTYTHASTYASTHTAAHPRIHASMHVRTHAHTHPSTNARTHERTHERTNARTQASKQARRCAQMHAHACTCTPHTHNI